MFKKNKYLNAIQALADNFILKALDIDLNTGDYEILKLGPYESKPKGLNIESWISFFTSNGYIHKDDISQFATFTNLDFLKRCALYKRSDTLKIKYKRSAFKNDEYREASLVIVPSKEKDHAYLFVYDAQY